MVKFGKNKFKALNKLAKKQNVSVRATSNKVIKKKINVEKKVSFQKEILIKEATSTSALVKTISPREVLVNELSRKPAKEKKQTAENTETTKLKHVEKKKKRRKTQISDAKLLLKLMKKK